MTKVNKDPFSNGTEFELWNERNCERCVKSSRYTRKQEYTKCRCAIQRDIITRMGCNEPISQRTIDVCRMEDCPYRKEHYSEHKHKRKQIEGMKYLFD